MKRNWPNFNCNLLVFHSIAGISDYKDGITIKKWQNFASLQAAAVMKSIVCGMDAPAID